MVTVVVVVVQEQLAFLTSVGAVRCAQSGCCEMSTQTSDACDSATQTSPPKVHNLSLLFASASLSALQASGPPIVMPALPATSAQSDVHRRDIRCLHARGRALHLATNHSNIGSGMLQQGLEYLPSHWVQGRRAESIVASRIQRQHFPVRTESTQALHLRQCLWMRRISKPFHHMD